MAVSPFYPHSNKIVRGVKLNTTCDSAANGFLLCSLWRKSCFLVVLFIMGATKNARPLYTVYQTNWLASMAGQRERENWYARLSIGSMYFVVRLARQSMESKRANLQHINIQFPLNCNWRSHLILTDYWLAIKPVNYEMIKHNSRDRRLQAKYSPFSPFVPCISPLWLQNVSENRFYPLHLAGKANASLTTLPSRHPPYWILVITAVHSPCIADFWPNLTGDRRKHAQSPPRSQAQLFLFSCKVQHLYQHTSIYVWSIHLPEIKSPGGYVSEFYLM